MKEEAVEACAATDLVLRYVGTRSKSPRSVRGYNRRGKPTAIIALLSEFRLAMAK